MPNVMTVSSGGMQGAFVSTMFANPVQILVTNAGVPQVGVTVSTTVPGAGASCTTAASAVSNGSGIASFTLTANGTAGQYQVLFSTSGATDVGSLFRNSTPSSTSQTKLPTLKTQEVNSRSGSLPWTNPGFIDATGSTNYAQITYPAINTDWGQMLKGSAFGFTIPTTASVTGYKVEMHTGRSSGAPAEESIYLFSGVFDAVTARRKNPSPGTWPTSASVGGSADLWGAAAFTPTQVNADNFNAGYIVGSQTNSTYRTNTWQVTVYYTIAPDLPVLPIAAPLVFCAN